MGAVAVKTLGGAGPDTVLIHGFGSDRLSWAGNSPALMTVSRVHALDLPGHGESCPDVGDGSVDALADRVAGALDQTGIGRAHLVGHSLGGAVALVLAEQHPERVASLTLIAPAGLGQQLDRNLLERLPALDDAEDILALLRTLVARPALINKMTAQRVLGQLAREGARDALIAIASGLLASEDRIRSAAESVSARAVPRLVLWGAEDAIYPLDQARTEAFGGDLHQIPAAGHLPHIEAFKTANDLMTTFLSSQSAG